MANRYSVIEEQSILKLLEGVPRGVSGHLTESMFSDKTEWINLKKNHPTGSILQKLTKTWRKSIIPINPAVHSPAQEKKDLNHGFNYCPGCGMKLNF